MLKLTTNHYLDPDQLAHIEINPAGQPFSKTCFTATFATEGIDPIQLSGPEAEEAVLNWENYHTTAKQNSSQ